MSFLGAGSLAQRRFSHRQLTYGVVSKGVFAESLRKFCGNSAETKFYCARKGCRNSTESLRKVRGTCGNFSAMTPSRTTPYHSLQNHYTHEITIFELFRDYTTVFGGRGVFELIFIAVTVYLFFYKHTATGNNSPQWFPVIFCNYSYINEWFLNFKCNDYVFFVPPFFVKEVPHFDRLISANLG